MTDLARLKEAAERAMAYDSKDWFSATDLRDTADPDDAAFIAAASPATFLSLLTTLQAQAADLELLTVFGQTRNLELSYQYEDLEGEGRWEVHQVNGGINDREWSLVGAGETPLAAIRASLGKGGGHG